MRTIESIPKEDLTNYVRREIINAMDLIVSSTDNTIVLENLGRFKTLDDMRRSAELPINLNTKTYKRVIDFYSKLRHFYVVTTREGFDAYLSLHDIVPEEPIDELNEIRKYPEIKKGMTLELCFERFGDIKPFIVDAVCPRTSESEFGNNNGAYIRLKEISQDNDTNFVRDTVEGIVIYRKSNDRPKQLSSSDMHDLENSEGI